MVYILRLPANSKAYLDVIHNEQQNHDDVLRFLYNYPYEGAEVYETSQIVITTEYPI